VSHEVPSPLQDEIDGLRIALRSRDTIGMAKGILMERHGLTPDQAFERLNKMSQDSNTKLRDVAAYLVDLRADLPAPLDARD